MIKKSNSDDLFELDIFKEEFSQLYYGFDNVFSTFETRGLGLFWKPLRLMYTKNKEYKIYLIIEYKNGRSANAGWFELLKEWLS